MFVHTCHTECVRACMPTSCRARCRASCDDNACDVYNHSHRSRSGPQKKSGAQACMQSGCGPPQLDRFPARRIALPPWSSSPRLYTPGRVQGCCFPLSPSIRPLRSCLALEPRPNKMKRPPSKGPRSGPGRCPRNTTSSTAG